MNTKLLRYTILACTLVGLMAILPLTVLATAEEEANKELAQNWVEDFMLTGNLRNAFEMAALNFVAHDINGDTMDLDELGARLSTMLADTYDRNFEFQTLFAKDDMVAMAWTEWGTLTWERIPPWAVSGVGVMRFENGQIAEFWFSLKWHAASKLQAR